MIVIHIIPPIQYERFPYSKTENELHAGPPREGQGQIAPGSQSLRGLVAPDASKSGGLLK